MKSPARAQTFPFTPTLHFTIMMVLVQWELLNISLILDKQLYQEFPRRLWPCPWTCHTEEV